ncbi:unnamed protein product [Rodentolepis nana]|uniref:Hexosyltransferase n=1 Tax=Rodentolepis nana TaxID=102285 RepID=A0A0R3T8U2_RODNA|nr:unnamed protein product [Rodentolepis nana]
MNGGFELKLPERSGHVAEMWVNRSEEARRLLYEEEDKYGDIIIGDFVDTYVNLTYKILTIHRWASVFCHGQTDVFLFMDDDYLFNAKNMLAYLKGFSREELRQMLRGPMMTWRHVIRPKMDNRKNKWAITQQEVPWSRLPTYAAGAAILIGADILDDMIISELYTRFLWVDDAYLGFVVAKLSPRQFEDLKGFYLESSNNDKALIPLFRYPTYVWGTARLIGADVPNELIIVEVYTHFLLANDAYLGFVMANLPSRQFRDMKGFYWEANNNKKALTYHTPIQLTFVWLEDNLKQFLLAVSDNSNLDLHLDAASRLILGFCWVVTSKGFVWDILRPSSSR